MFNAFVCNINIINKYLKKYFLNQLIFNYNFRKCTVKIKLKIGKKRKCWKIMCGKYNKVVVIEYFCCKNNTPNDSFTDYDTFIEPYKGVIDMLILQHIFSGNTR